MRYEELDDVTRRYMLSELEVEFTGNPYLSDGLTPEGRAAFPNLMREAIRAGNEVTLAASLAQLRYWRPMETYRTKTGRIMRRHVNVREATERLGLTEFNTWYIRGLAKRLFEEGVSHCQVYRAAPPKGPPGECTRYEEQVFTVDVIYRGHRARYWPVPNPGAMSIPAGPNCHHTIRRVR